MWITPKTNWSKDDYFNATDFNRIKNNLIHLREMAIKLYPQFNILCMGEDKTYSDYLYADEINTIEDNLDSINRHTLRKNYGEKRNYFPNGEMIDYKELNRIENAITDIFNNLTNGINGRRYLTFNFGTRRIL